MQTRIVTTADSDLFVVEDGDPSQPAILFLHGFPDCHKVWENQLRDLAKEFHVISFDMRGCGKSTPSTRSDAYRIDHLLPDIAAVIDATCGVGAKVHLVGHDWGSVIGWSFVGDAWLGQRVLSWTSMSGPHAGLVFQTMAQRLRSGNLRQLRQAWDQFAHSWYIFALNIPGLGRTLFRFGGVRAWRRAMLQGGVAADDPYLNITQNEVERLTFRPIGLYQQNLFSPPEPLTEGSVTIPVQLLVPLKDSFVRAHLYEDLHRICPALERVDLNANHWAQRTHAEEITRLIRNFVARFNPEQLTAEIVEVPKPSVKKKTEAVAKKSKINMPPVDIVEPAVKVEKPRRRTKKTGESNEEL